jgi:hypothetical protein
MGNTVSLRDRAVPFRRAASQIALEAAALLLDERCHDDIRIECCRTGVVTRPLSRFRAKHALGLDPGVDAGSREENASNQEAGTLSVLIDQNR